MSQLKWALFFLSPSILASELAINLEGESLEYFERDTDSSLYQLTVSGEYKLNTSNDFRLYLNPRVRKSNQSGLKDEAQLIEGYMDVRLDNSDLRVGQQIISWGRADIVNPISIGRQNFADPLDDDNEKLGQFGINYRHYIANGQIETIWLPVFQSSTLPEVDSPWFANLPAATPSNQTIAYDLADTDTPSNSLKNSQWGLRYTTVANGWDLGASYFKGWNDVPAYASQVTAASVETLVVQITPTPYRNEMLGVDLATTLDGYSFRAEYAHIFTKDNSGTDPLVDDPYSHLVLGFDTNFSDLFDSVTNRLLIEYSRQFKTTNIKYTTQDLNHIFEDTIFVRLAVEDQAVWSMEIDAAYDFENKGQLLRPKGTYNLVDDLTLSLSFEWLKGNNESFFGSYKDNRSVRMTLSHEALVF